jgi:ankyrin repeat protein
MESLLQSFLSMKSGQSGKSRGKMPQFPGITEDTTTSNKRDGSTDPHKFNDVLRAVEELTNGAFEFDDLRQNKADKKTYREWKPIHFAAQNGSRNLIKAYIERGALVDSREDDNWTPLMLAAQNGHLEACRLLVDNGADVNAQGVDGHTALMQASATASADIVKLLLSEGADVSVRNNFGRTPFFACIIRAIGEKDREASLQIAQILLEAGADPNTLEEHSVSPLFYVCIMGCLDVVKFLLNNGADPNQIGAEGLTCLQAAAHESYPDIIELLMQYGADPNEIGDKMWTPLHFTVQFDKELTLHTARALVRGGADIDALTDVGVTPVYLAVQAKRLDVARFLLSEGAQQIDHRTIRDVTPLERAIAGSDLNMVNLLLEYGARTDLVGAKGFNIVHIAAMQDDINVFKRILDTEADIDLASRDGRDVRPLHLASQRDNEEFAMALLERGAMP